MSNQYFRYPVAYHNDIYMVSHQSLWKWSGSILTRISSFGSDIKDLKIFDNNLSFFSREESNGDVYKYNLLSGVIQRMTFFDDRNIKNVHLDDKQVIVSSSYKNPFRDSRLYSINNNREVTEFPYLDAEYMAISTSETVLQRYGYGYHMWRNYQGGTAARLYRLINNQLVELKFAKNNAYNPVLFEDRLFFISDPDGVPNIYEYFLNKNEWKQVTFHKDYCVRDLSIWGNKILYTSGGDVYTYDIVNNKSDLVVITGSDYSHTESEFLSATESITFADVNDKGNMVSCAIRGHVFGTTLWEKTFIQFTNQIRYRITAFLGENEILCIRDDGDKSYFDVFEAKTFTLLESHDYQVGLVQTVLAVDKQFILCSNNKGNLYQVNLRDKKLTHIIRGRGNRIWGFDASPDQKWVVYSIASPAQDRNGPEMPGLYLYNLESKLHHKITSGFNDTSPSFSKDGKYIYFLSDIDLLPKYDPFYFNMYFQSNSAVCAICVNAQVEHPFKPWIFKADSDEQKADEKTITKSDEKVDGKTEGVANEATKSTPPFPEIKLDEIRCVKSELPKGKYYSVIHLVDSKLLIASHDTDAEKIDQYALHVADITTNQINLISNQVDSMSLSNNREWMIISTGGKLRVGRAGEQFDDNDKSYKNSGWINTSGILMYVNPKQEWSHIINECWWLAKERFWNQEQFKSINIAEKYEKLLPKIRSREDLNILLEEIIGELGTSHNYVINRGENNLVVHQPQGYLGADFKWNNGYEIVKIDNTCDFDGFYISPLLDQGVNLMVGDIIVAVDGHFCKQNHPIEHYLRNKGKKNTVLTIKRANNTFLVHVSPMSNLRHIEYRKWINNNRNYVHSKSNGRIGYLHIPDMMKDGFIEFSRGYAMEHWRDGLIIDARYNGGGNVSPIIQSILQRIQQGIDLFGDQVLQYPSYSNQGRMVLLCNQYTGSDGDMITHKFKMQKMGQVIGKRTWGGVIGIFPQHEFIDNGLTSQAEYAMWMKDVGLSIENHGVDPDIEIENMVNIGDVDEQLNTGIDLLMQNMPILSVTDQIIHDFDIKLAPQKT